MQAGYELITEVPSSEDYRQLRISAGMSPKSEAAAAGLPNSLFGVVVRHEGRVVGMGRLIGDGGLFFQVVDIAVAPAHRTDGAQGHRHGFHCPVAVRRSCGRR